jgi:hypothetical protein
MKILQKFFRFILISLTLTACSQNGFEGAWSKGLRSNELYEILERSEGVALSARLSGDLDAAVFRDAKKSESYDLAGYGVVFTWEHVELSFLIVVDDKVTMDPLTVFGNLPEILTDNIENKEINKYFKVKRWNVLEIKK